ncbi:hypothetical protein, partial [Pseudomonas aeruginosa]|uniref:hypothetical protein n=1 Tax=Pseudomonas aeruginosa TaxID=287 RepID=UPI0019668834
CVNPRPRRVSFLWYSMGWASSGAISTASLIFQIRAKTATALHSQGKGAADHKDMLQKRQLINHS